MELNSIDRLNLSNIERQGVNQIQNTNMEKVNLDSNDNSFQIDKVELQNQNSPFANNLIHNVKQISAAFNLQATISQQLDITDEIKHSVNAVISNPNSSLSLNDIQPKIKALMDNFNTLSNSISSDIDSNDKPKSRIYFDGILGAKPLSSKEILKEVDAQRERLQNSNKKANDEVLDTIQKSKELFNTQKQALIDQQPKLKEIDFKGESDNFSAKTLQNIPGSVVDTQANGQVDQNIKLLAS